MSVDERLQEARPSFSDAMRVRFKGVLDPIAGALIRLGLMPNTITLLGLAGNIIGAFLLAVGNFLAGGILVLIMGPIDALDGAMARLRNEPTDFGGFVDSVTDRYSELIIYAGLTYAFVSQGDSLMILLAFFAAAGSVLVSYVKARAESLGYDGRGGILTRFERYLVLAPALILYGLGVSQAALVGLVLIAVLANITALQRIRAVRIQARRRLGK
ncbi:MAG TPA: CDP-alcohol phosphatidyltransferase family protein [Anaerolineales bacterium]|nr:CDP-alcohol phosphatidyltransferase family protein [Anaerolineales bacterium]